MLSLAVANEGKEQVYDSFSGPKEAFTQGRQVRLAVWKALTG